MRTRESAQQPIFDEIRRGNSRISQDDPRSTAVLDDESRFAVVTGQATDGARQMIAMQAFDVVDLERFLAEVQPKRQHRAGEGRSSLPGVRTM